MLKHSLPDDPEEVVMPRKKRGGEEMDITPMIDITFLLLIFFVVCSKMDPTQTSEIPTAQNALPISADNSAVIFLEPGSNDTVVLKRRDESQFSDDDETLSGELVDYITAEMMKTVDENKRQVMLLGSPELRVHHVTRVQRMIGDAFEDIDFTYIAVKEE